LYIYFNHFYLFAFPLPSRQNNSAVIAAESFALPVPIVFSRVFPCKHALPGRLGTLLRSSCAPADHPKTMVAISAPESQCRLQGMKKVNHQDRRGSAGQASNKFSFSHRCSYGILRGKDPLT
jgi:hypothetical protein